MEEGKGKASSSRSGGERGEGAWRKLAGERAVGRVGREAVVAYYAVVIGPWGLFLFLALAAAVLWAADRWMAALGFWYDEGKKGGGSSPTRVFLATLSTAAAVGAWYVLAFVALLSGA